MADRIYKGCLVTVNNEAFPEASESFDKPHKGGLEPYQMLCEVFKAVEQSSPDSDYPIRSLATRTVSVKEIDDSLWVTANDVWIKIDKDGSFEIGTSGV